MTLLFKQANYSIIKVLVFKIKPNRKNIILPFCPRINFYLSNAGIFEILTHFLEIM